MNIRQMPLEELELLSYTDIAYELLKLDKKSATTPVLFGEVCKLLQIDENSMYEMIGDFYTTLTTDKRFILIDSVNWDLKENHVVKVVVDDGEDDAVDVVDDEEESEDEEEETTDEDDAIEDDYTDESDDDYMEDDLEDLNIVDEDDIEE